MDELRAKKLQGMFEAVSRECGIKTSVGYFIDDDQTVILICNNIMDKDLLRLAVLLVTQASRKYEIPPEDILGVMLEQVEGNLKSGGNSWDN